MSSRATYALAVGGLMVGLCIGGVGGVLAEKYRAEREYQEKYKHACGYAIMEAERLERVKK